MTSYSEYVLVLVAVNAILAISAYLPLASGVMVVCLGASMGAGGVVAAEVFARTDAGFPVALCAGALAGGALAALPALFLARLSGFGFALMTLGIGEMARVVVVNVPALGGALGYRDVVLRTGMWEPLIVCVAVIGIGWAMEKSAFRNALRLLKASDTVATAVGVSAVGHRMTCVIIGGSLAGVAGALYAHNVGIVDPRLFGFENSMQIVIFAIVGGTRAMWGCLVAAAVLTVLPELLRCATSIRYLLNGLILMLIVTRRPEGLWRSSWISPRRRS